MRREEDRWGRNRTAAAGFHHRKYRAAGARGVGRRERRQQDIDDHHRIAQRQRALAHELHREQRDAPPQPGGLVAQREDKGAEHQPDGGAGEARQPPFQRLFTGLEARLRQLLRAEQHPVGAQHADGHCDKADGGGRDRLQNHADDHRHEDGEVVPACGGMPSGTGINNRIASTASGAIAFQIFSGFGT